MISTLDDSIDSALTPDEALERIQVFLGKLGYDEGAIVPHHSGPSLVGSYLFDYTTPLGTSFTFYVDAQGGVSVHDLAVFEEVPQ